jgi:hypothetical protein
LTLFKGMIIILLDCHNPNLYLVITANLISVEMYDQIQEYFIIFVGFTIENIWHLEIII